MEVYKERVICLMVVNGNISFFYQIFDISFTVLIYFDQHVSFFTSLK